MDQNSKPIDFRKFDLEVGFEDLQPQISGAGEKKSASFEEILFEELKDLSDFKREKLSRKGIVWSRYKALDGEEKRMKYEDLFLTIVTEESQYEYAIEVDQDFHIPKWSNKRQNYQYTPIYEILREAAYFEIQKSFALLRFGYDDGEKKKDEQGLINKFRIFLRAFCGNDSEGLHEYLEKIQSKRSRPLVVFVDYPKDNPHIQLHQKMDSKPERAVMLAYRLIGNVSPDIHCYFVPSDQTEEKKISEYGDFEYLMKYDLTTFAYERQAAEDVAEKEQREIIENFNIDSYLFELEDKFKRLLVSDLKRREFRQLIQKFQSGYKQLLDTDDT